MTPIKPTLVKRAPRGMEMARLGSREMREFIETEAIDIFTTMTNGGCTFQQSLAAIFLSGMNAAENARKEL